MRKATRRILSQRCQPVTRCWVALSPYQWHNKRPSRPQRCHERSRRHSRPKGLSVTMFCNELVVSNQASDPRLTSREARMCINGRNIICVFLFSSISARQNNKRKTFLHSSEQSFYCSSGLSAREHCKPNERDMRACWSITSACLAVVVNKNLVDTSDSLALTNISISLFADGNTTSIRSLKLAQSSSVPVVVTIRVSHIEQLKPSVAQHVSTEFKMSASGQH